ncbi:MAG: hypothetical protein CO137_02770 [Candidatus Magasanikbacteria bacterium CG_4_9_14_3_um_filter_32_9]|uniref:Uncharacterized protein n=1 Tax=Candidatus Magasanikbacteria bacterium CG_4_9_14_3_um_filter_32_9 TaxID=1974644 RepID=A0A2M7Z6F9_9BACT|nr:MAG: hypothetical protein CO137_02770 [Candidatus Magasanikbacteria bacterium CG_4_9_14_3_um_filter_32_9]
MPTKLSSPPIATEYIIVQPQTTLVGSITPANIELLQREIILQAQGEAVELSDGISPLTTALSFSAIYDIADETVFRLSNGQLVLLFDHQPKETLRPEEVEESIWTKILKIKSKSVVVQDISAPKPEIILDLVALWGRIREQDDIIARTKLFIKSFAKALEPAITIRLCGEIPNLPLLSAIYLARPYGHTIIFEDAHNESVTLFTNI